MAPSLYCDRISVPIGFLLKSFCFKPQRNERTTDEISAMRDTSVLPRRWRWAVHHSVRLPVRQEHFSFLCLFFNDRNVHLLLYNVLNMQRTHSKGRKGPGSPAHSSHQSMPRSSEIPNPDQDALGACNTLDWEAAWTLSYSFLQF